MNRAVSPVSPVPPPHNHEAEQAILGMMLFSEQACARGISVLRPDSFYPEAHRLIFSALVALSHSGKSPDLILITDWLSEAGQLNAAGGAGYLTSLYEGTFSDGTFGYYLEIVQRDALKRALINLGLELRTLPNGELPEAVIERMRTKLETLTSIESGKRLTGLVHVSELRNEPVNYLVDGLLPRGMLALLSGRDKRGKTLLALEICRSVLTGKRLFGHFTVQQGPVAGFFLDDPESLTSDRLQTLGINIHPELYVSTSKRANLNDSGVFLREVGVVAKEVGAILIVLDALYLFIPHGRETANDQARMAPIMGLLNWLPENTGATTLLIAHDAKSGLDVAGSHVIRAAAKTILRLVLPKSAEEDPDDGRGTPQRVLKIESKLVQSNSLALELCGVGDWKFMGTQQEFATETLKGLVISYLASGGKNTVEQIARALKRRSGDVQAAIEILTQEGRIYSGKESSGGGRPHRVYSVGDLSSRSDFPSQAPEGKVPLKPRVYQQDLPSGGFPSRLPVLGENDGKESSPGPRRADDKHPSGDFSTSPEDRSINNRREPT